MSKTLTFHGHDNPLIETVDFMPTKVVQEDVLATDPAIKGLTEAARPNKRLVIEGVFQRADVRNANKRVYPRGIWEKLLDETSPVMQGVRERSMIGHLEHPEDGTTNLNNGAILITDLKMDESGAIIGRAIVYNTPEGQRVQEYIDTGTKIGISSRGTGSIDSDGIVQEDYNLDSFDIVARPSTPGAHPKREGAAAAAEAAAAATATLGEAAPVPAAAPAATEVPVVELTGSDATGGFRAGGPGAVSAGTPAPTPANLGTKPKIEPNRTTREQPGAVPAAFGDNKGQVGDLNARCKTHPSAIMANGQCPVCKIPGPANKDTAMGAPNGTAPDQDQANMDPGGTASGHGSTAATNESVETLRALLAEAATTITELTTAQETAVASAAASKLQLEALQADVTRARASLVARERVIAALTGVNYANQVAEAVADQVRKHPALAEFREVLAAQASAIAVEAKAVRLLRTITENTSQPQKRNPAALESRLRQRTRIAEHVGLPTPSDTPTSSDDDAVNVSEVTTPVPVTVEPITEGARKSVHLAKGAVSKLASKGA